MKKPSIDDSGERMIPEAHKGMHIYDEHIARYGSVQSVVSGKRVLDIACGTGYGSKLMAKTAKQVIGVDVSSEAIRYAQSFYGGSNIRFEVGDAVNLPLQDASVDVIVCFETIEHIKDYEAFLLEARRVLAPGGQFIVSTPNDPEFPEGNHFHLHEFELHELKKLMLKNFKQIGIYYQALWLFSGVISEKSFESEKLDETFMVQKTSRNDPQKCLYITLVCSDSKPVELESVGSFGEIWSERQYLMEKKKIGDQALKIHELWAEIKRLRARKTDLESELEHALGVHHQVINSRTWRYAKRLRRIIKKVR